MRYKLSELMCKFFFWLPAKRKVAASQHLRLASSSLLPARVFVERTLITENRWDEPKSNFHIGISYQIQLSVRSSEKLLDSI